MQFKNLTLISRSNELNSVMTHTHCTDANGQPQDIEKTIFKFIEQLILNREQGGAVYLIGNGGSAGVASHSLTDFLNVCRLRAFTLHDSSLITCMANDFGYENAFARILNTILRTGDILIAISSSGKSANICHAAKAAKELGGIVITLSGFDKNNPLRQLGDLNFWLDSCDYGMIEIGHQFILHNVSDRIAYEAVEKKLQAV
jgi:D-sedoheptulose 7-phosphate isomerase